VPLKQSITNEAVATESGVVIDMNRVKCNDKVLV
jgi:hypothetical protein